MNRDEAHVALSTATGWYKAQASQGQNGCVEVNVDVPGWAGLRDSKLGPDSPVLVFTAIEYDAMITRAKAGEFHHRNP